MKRTHGLAETMDLYGFCNETTFLTKSGDLGVVLKIGGVDFESLDQAGQEFAVKRLEAALKSFGLGFHVHQYLFKTNRPEMPFAHYGDPLIDAAIDQRREFFESKRDRLYEIEIFYAVVLEGERSKTGIGVALGRFPSDPNGAIRELKAQFAGDNMKVLLRSQITGDQFRREERVQAFRQQVSDVVEIEVLTQADQFRFFRRLLNFDDWRIAGKPQASQYLDYQVVNSNIEAERDHLRVGDHYVRLLTMKQQQDAQIAAALASAQTPAQQQAATQYGANGQQGVAPPQPYTQGQPQANSQAQLTLEEQQRQQLAGKERELAFSSRFASNLAYSRSQEQARSQQANSQAQAVPVASSPYAAALAGGDGSSFTPARAAGEAPASPAGEPVPQSSQTVSSCERLELDRTAFPHSTHIPESQPQRKRTVVFFFERAGPARPLRNTSHRACRFDSMLWLDDDALAASFPRLNSANHTSSPYLHCSWSMA